jgi:type III secretion system chaperone SycN
MNIAPWIAATLADFGASLGVGPLQLGADNSVTLRFDGGDAFCVQVLEDEVLAISMRPLPHNAQSTKERALQAAGMPTGSPFALQVGITRDQQLAAIVRVPSRRFDLAAIEAARAQGIRLLTEAAGGRGAW